MKTVDTVFDRHNKGNWPVTHILNPLFKFSRHTDLAKRFAEVRAIMEARKK